MVAPEITINVNLSSDASQAATAVGRAEAAAAAPPPMALDQLQSVTAAFAPSPAEPSTLQAQSAIAAAEAGAAPPPMDIARLQGTMAADAPSPVSFGTLADTTTAPVPTLQALDVAATDGAPGPMPIADLEVREEPKTGRRG